MSLGVGVQRVEVSPELCPCWDGLTSNAPINGRILQEDDAEDLPPKKYSFPNYLTIIHDLMFAKFLPNYWRKFTKFQGMIRALHCMSL